jgi:NAD(P)-dependent dehydrogenase (short-subunit alcohol dehydrogenase family)
MRVFITGGANGIGKATVEQLLDHGHDVIVFDIDENALQDLPADVTAYHGDVSDEKRVQEVVGQETFDVLINCAGYQEQGAIEDMTMDAVEKQFETNFFGLLNVIRTAMPMLRDRNGRVINISSLAGKTTGPFWGVYSASKHAVEAASNALRMEVNEFGVDVVVVEPGAIKTGFNERGRQMLKQYLPESVYAERYREKLAQEQGGVSPEKAAATIVTAVEADRPKPRYTVTWEALIGPKLKLLLPTRVWDWLARQW